MDTVSIVIISVLGVLLLAVIVVLIIFLIRPRHESSSNVDAKLITKDIEIATSKQISDLNEKLNNRLNGVTSELKDQSVQQAKANTEELNKFKDNIRESIDKKFDNVRGSLNERFDAMDTKVNKKLDDSFKSTSETMSKFGEDIQHITDTQQDLAAMSKDVLSLKNVLEGNQSRGAYGERRLEAILAGVLGENSKLYDTQYDLTLDNGDKVRPDAVLFLTNDLILCIDSKFPLTHYQLYLDATTDDEKQNQLAQFTKDVEDKIDEISSKYIVDGKTYQQALMFVPSDGIYAYLNGEDSEIWDYATKNHVSLVCPCTIGPVLTGILMLKNEEIRNQNAQRIAQDLNELSLRFATFQDAWKSVSKKIGGLNTSKGTLNTAVRELSNSFNDINRSNKYLLSNNEPIPNETENQPLELDFSDILKDDENDDDEEEE